MESKKSIHCTLTDHELAAKADQWLDELIGSGGKSWMLSIPARPNVDPDLIFAELNNRFKRMVGQPRAAWVKAETPPPAKRWHGKVRTVNRMGELNERQAAWFPGWEVEGPCDEYVSEWYDESAGESDAVDDWIDVNDRLPEEGGRYWCYVQHLTDLGFSYFQWNCDYNPQLQRFSDMTLKNGERITHWRPLAHPPIFKQQKEK